MPAHFVTIGRLPLAFASSTASRHVFSPLVSLIVVCLWSDELVGSGARASGPELEHVRSSLFDFVWTQRAAMKANRIASSSHYWPWLIDFLWDICNGWLSLEEMPAVLHNWDRCYTDRSIAPVTCRGTDWGQLSSLNARGAHTIEISVLRSNEEMLAVLQFPDLVVRADVAGIERLTGVDSHLFVGYV